MKPRLEILPPAQQKLWPLLANTPQEFTLYGGTAIALQLGHRESVDFDFFSAQPLNKEKIINTLTFLKDSAFIQPEINTLNCQVELSEGIVKLQFLAGLNTRQGRIEPQLISEDNRIQIASLRDLLASKLNTIQMRAEIKDYMDIFALLKHGLTLEDGLGCAQAVFGNNFDPATSLRALCSYRDGDLQQLSQEIKDVLIKTAININTIPKITTISSTI